MAGGAGNGEAMPDGLLLVGQAFPEVEAAASYEARAFGIAPPVELLEASRVELGQPSAEAIVDDTRSAAALTGSG